MKAKTLTISEIVLIAGTRVALGVGIGLLLSSRLSVDQRKTAGWSLFAGGALSSVPLAMAVIRKASPIKESVELAA